MTADSADVDVLVVGAGQAGLAIGYELRQAGKDFLIVEAGTAVGGSWRRRWDSLRLFTSARHSGLPGRPFPAPADHYPSKDGVADYLTGYAEDFGLPIRLGTSVRKLRHGADGRFEAITEHGSYSAQAVVVATGPFQQPAIPAMARNLASDVTQIHTNDYRSPAQLPEGPTLVIGAGNSGLQIAEELSKLRPVTLAVGSRQPAIPQRVLGRDVFTWLDRLGVMRAPAEGWLGRRIRERDPLIGTNLRRLKRRGVKIVDRRHVRESKPDTHRRRPRDHRIHSDLGHRLPTRLQLADRPRRHRHHRMATTHPRHQPDLWPVLPRPAIPTSPWIRTSRLGGQ
ncbi:flavin-containing monooxygenase [Actinopolymorpha alba]|uniref:flavin-containing monooxygenase n=1 Tax=Actinopolymorpha alba TaxID=533267 RepID=UPI0003A30D36|nr:NAD(P)/FAD-dependent oxidoreductase [Actinopolymorpha alba]